MPVADMNAKIAENAAAVRAQIDAAARRAGREPADVLLVGVTKYVGLAAIRGLLAAGVCDLGESRVQQLTRRVQALGGRGRRLDDGVTEAQLPRWHMVGHLQRNKAKFVLPDVSIVHSVESERLLDVLDQLAGREDVCVDILVEVNVAGEASKYGTAVDELDRLLAEAERRAHLRLCGLMTMAPLGPTPEAARPHFARLRELLDDARRRGAVGSACRHLSMGMSQDYVVAVEEGATIVRVGSALFDGLAPEAAAAD